MREGTDEPTWPIRVTFSDGEVMVLTDVLDVETSLECFDSEDPEDPSTVVDASGRPMVLLVDLLKILICRLK